MKTQDRFYISAEKEVIVVPIYINRNK